MISRMPGRRILTTTSSPLFERGGVHLRDGGGRQRRGSKLAKISPSGRPKVLLDRSRRRWRRRNGGTRSCSFASSSAMSTGSRSRRVDSAWPNFTKIGPSSSSASRRRSPRVAPGAALKPGPWRQIEQEAKRPVQMRRAHEIVQAVPDQRALDLAAAGRATRSTHQRRRPLPGAARGARAAPRSRSAASRDRSTPRRNSSISVSADQIAAFLLQVFGDVLAGGAPRASRPGAHAPGELRQMPRRQVADEARQLFLRDPGAPARTARGTDWRSRHRRGSAAAAAVASGRGRSRAVSIRSSAGGDPEITASASAYRRRASSASAARRRARGAHARDAFDVDLQRLVPSSRARERRRRASTPQCFD